LEIGQYVLPDDVKEEMREVAAVIASETSKPDPDALTVARASSRLEKLKEWAAAKADAAADEFAKGFGKSAGTAAGVGAVALVLATIGKLLGMSWDWLMAILPVL
jgi:hypothetical protein